MATRLPGGIRKTADGKTVLLVALTGWGQKEDIEKSLNAGFDFHMTKPADPERIERLLDNFLQSAERRQDDAGEPASTQRLTTCDPSASSSPKTTTICA